MGTITKRKQDDGTFRIYRSNGTTRLEVPGFPGLFKREIEGTEQNWQIDRTIRGMRFKFALPIASLDAAKRAYTTFELDPDGFARSLRKSLGPPDYKTLIETYLSYMKTKGNKLKSIQNISGVLWKAYGVARRENLDMNSIAGVTAFLKERKLGANSTRQYMRNLKSFFRWCVVQHLLGSNVIELMAIPRGEQTLEDRRRIIGEEELDKVLDKLTTERHIHALMALWALGLRSEELVRAKPRDVSRERMEVFIARSKHGRSRHVPIPDLAIYNALLAFTKTNTKNLMMLKRNLDRIWERYPDLPRFTLHALRHSRITNWLIDGCSIYDVMRWAGHSSIAQTMVYVGEVQQSIKRPSPTAWAYGNGAPLQLAPKEDPRSEEDGRENPDEDVVQGLLD